MSDNVLREFLVSLGFKVDEVGMKKFTTSVESVTKTVLKLGAEVAAAATGVVAGVKIISSQMENLYYASQRTGATVGNIMALRYAAGQIGLTADQAQGALENFARTLRLNPGSNSLLDSLGVAGGDPSERFTSFIEKMKGQQPYVAAAYAQLFGIDPDTLLMLENGLARLEDEQEKYKERLEKFKITPEQAAAAGVDFNNSFRSVKETFNDLWIVIESKLAPVLAPLIDQFDRWAKNHAGEVAQGIADAVQSLANWIQSVNWKKVGDDITDVYHAIGGLKGILIGLAAIQLMPLVAAMINLAAAVTGLGSAALGLTTGGAMAILGRLGIAGLASWAGLKVAKAAGLPDVNRDKGVSDIEKDDWIAASSHLSAVEFLAAMWKRSIGKSNKEIVADLRKSLPNPDAKDERLDGSGDGNEQFGSIIELPQSKAPRGIRNNNPGNIVYGDFAKRMGATASDGRFAVFQSMEDGIKAAIKLLEGYVAKGYDTVRKIISRWAPAGENNTSAYVDAVAKKLGISADAHLSGDQLGGVAQAIFQHENGRAFSNIRSLDQARLGGAGRSSPSVNIQQQNTFHIPGSSDPQGTARAVGGEQSRVNGDLVRNFAGAFR